MGTNPKAGDPGSVKELWAFESLLPANMQPEVPPRRAQNEKGPPPDFQRRAHIARFLCHLQQNLPNQLTPVTLMKELPGS